MLSTTKSADHPIHQRYPLGILAQEFLKPVIEHHIREPISFTISATDTMDAESDSFLIEIKRRLPPYRSDDKYMKQGCLIPACKILRAYDEKKTVRFYYYFDTDKSLWFWDFNQKEIESCECRVPSFHRDNQPHYYVPISLWKRV